MLALAAQSVACTSLAINNMRIIILTPRKRCVSAQVSHPLYTKCTRLIQINPFRLRPGLLRRSPSLVTVINRNSVLSIQLCSLLGKQRGSHDVSWSSAAATLQCTVYMYFRYCTVKFPVSLSFDLNIEMT